MSVKDRALEIPIANHILKGILNVPQGARGIVLFAHGSGSGRLSPRNQFVAGELQNHGVATLLFDLLGEDEADDRAKVFDIDLLAERLEATAEWVETQDEINELSMGFFGASTGAAAALVAAAHLGSAIKAVVSRGGRPDLAMDLLVNVKAPTLLIVGGDDETVVELNQTALDELRCEKHLAIVPGATHLFPEPGALEEVARLAAEWFEKHFV
jgi:putative phosphoribosyl transferase